MNTSTIEAFALYSLLLRIESLWCTEPHRTVPPFCLDSDLVGSLSDWEKSNGQNKHNTTEQSGRRRESEEEREGEKTRKDHQKFNHCLSRPKQKNEQNTQNSEQLPTRTHNNTARPLFDTPVLLLPSYL